MKRKLGILGVVVCIAVITSLASCDLDGGFDTPEGVTATLLANGDVHITWERVPGASHYSIAFRTNLDAAGTRTNVSSGERNTSITHWSAFGFQPA